MKNSFLKTVRNSIKHWYIHLIAGIIFVGVGIYTLVSPLASYVALSVLFSISFLSSGLLEVVFSISNRKEIDGWGWNLTFGLITLIMGILLVANPEISMATLPFYVGFLMLFRSIMGIGWALDMKNYKILDWGNLMAISILGVLFSFLLLWNPLLAGMTVVFWTGLALITSGAFGIYFSFRLKKMNAYADKIPEDLQNRYDAIQLEIQNELNKS